MATGGNGDWLRELGPGLEGFLASLAVAGKPGRHLPCPKGITAAGRKAALGFSCLALKLSYTIGAWDRLPAEQRRAWTDFICSFQVAGPLHGEAGTVGGFVDPALAAHLRAGGPAGLLRRLRGAHNPAAWPLAVRAESKQAIATLAEVGAQAPLPWRGLPAEPEAALAFLRAQDWSRPWAAGAQAAHLAVYLAREAPRAANPERAGESRRLCAGFLAGLADEDSGAYFAGPRPDPGEMINGAMKVLTALDWLEEPVHRPERLIAATIAYRPPAEGCHLVDAAYVLHRCTRQCPERAGEVRDYCQGLLAAVREHLQPDGGFSYFLGRSQMSYYGLPITTGQAAGDLHGSLLLAWAVAMITDMLGEPLPGWRVIRP